MDATPISRINADGPTINTKKIIINASLAFNTLKIGITIGDKFFGWQAEYIYRVRAVKSVWAVDRLDKSIRFQLGKLVIYKMDKGTFWNIKTIVDRKGVVTVA